MLKEKIDKLYWKTHNFDLVQCRFLKNDKENAYVKERNAKMLVHGIHEIEKLPPSLRHRETVYFNTDKPVPKQILEIDEMRKEKKK